MDRVSFFMTMTSVLALVGIGMQLWFAAGLFVVATPMFLATGAFTASYVTVVLGWPLAVGALIALAVAALLAVVLVPLLFRLSGIQLAMASLAASEIIRLVAINLTWLTGGSGGRIVPRALDVRQAVGVALLGFAFAWFLQRSTRGDRLEVLRHDRRVAGSLGLDVRRWEASFFVAGALVTALAGVVLAHVVRFISPQEFGLHYGIDAIAIAVIGGRRSWAGPFFGVLVIAVVPFLLNLSAFWSEVLTGLLLIAVLLLAPNGVAEFVEPRVRRLLVRRRSSAAASTADEADGEEDGAAYDIGGPAALAVRDLSFAYGGVRALDRVSFEARPGEVVAIIGPNGAGKTTLIDACTGIAGSRRGAVVVAGAAASRPLGFARLGVRRTFQHVQLVERLSLLTNVKLGALLAGANADVGPTAHRSIRAVGLAGSAEAPPGAVSLGSRRLAEIARVIAARPRVALLDEPSSGCDEHSVEQMGAAIRDLASRSCAVIVVSHDLRFVADVADRIVLMSRGRVVKELPVAELETDADVQRVYLGVANA